MLVEVVVPAEAGVVVSAAAEATSPPPVATAATVEESVGVQVLERDGDHFPKHLKIFFCVVLPSATLCTVGKFYLKKKKTTTKTVIPFQGCFLCVTYTQKISPVLCHNNEQKVQTNKPTSTPSHTAPRHIHSTQRVIHRASRKDRITHSTLHL